MLHADATVAYNLCSSVSGNKMNPRQTPIGCENPARASKDTEALEARCQPIPVYAPVITSLRTHAKWTYKFRSEKFKSHITHSKWSPFSNVQPSSPAFFWFLLKTSTSVVRKKTAESCALCSWFISLCPHAIKHALLCVVLSFRLFPL